MCNLRGRYAGCAQWLFVLTSELLKALSGVNQRLSCGCLMKDTFLPGAPDIIMLIPPIPLQVRFGMSQRLHCGCKIEGASRP